VAAVAAAALFFGVLLFGGSLHGYDWGSHHYNYFDWVRTSLVQHHTLPLFMNDAWITKNFLANAEAPSLGPLVGLLSILSTGAYIKLLIVVFTAAGLAGMFLLLRDLGVAAPLAALRSCCPACSASTAERPSEAAERSSPLRLSTPSRSAGGSISPSSGRTSCSRCSRFFGRSSYVRSSRSGGGGSSSW
jgi:hypothetical protein